MRTGLHRFVGVLHDRVFVSPELSSVRDYVITHSVRSMYVVCVCMYVCGILQNWSLYPHTLMYCHGTWTQWSLGRVTHVTSTDMGQRSSRGQWPLVQVFGKKRVSVSTYCDVFSNLILQWLQKYVIAKAGETRGSRIALFWKQLCGFPDVVQVKKEIMILSSRWWRFELATSPIGH